MSRHPPLQSIAAPGWDRPVDREGFVLAVLALQTERFKEAAQRARSLLEAVAEETDSVAASPPHHYRTSRGPSDFFGKPAAVDLVPTVRDATVLLADALYLEGYDDACLEHCDRAFEAQAIPPDDPYPDLLRGWIYFKRGQARTAQELANHNLKKASSCMSPAVHASFLHLRAMCDHRLGHTVKARRKLRDAVALSRTAGDMIVQAEAMNALGVVEAITFTLPVAMSRFEETLRMSDKLGRPLRRAQCLLNLSVARIKSGRAASALPLIEEAEVLQQANMHTHIPICLKIARAKALLQLDRTRESTEAAAHALAVSSQGPFPREESLSLETLGDSAQKEGRFDTARRYYERALVIAENIAPKIDLVAGQLRRLGELSLAENDPRDAVPILRQGVRIAQQVGERYEEGILQRFLARGCWQMGQYDTAYKACRSGITVLREMGAELELAHNLLEASRLQLSWWRTGQDSSDGLRAHLEAAWSYAIEAWHGFADLEREDWCRVSTELMDELRAEVEPPWRVSKFGKRLMRDDHEEGASKGKIDLVTAAEERTAEEEVFIAEALPMKRLLNVVQVAAASGEPALITGETGTGKERVARLVHEGSKRKDGPWVAVNCAAIPHTLFEREFFGHSRGAYTGAEGDHSGLCEQADGGTLFLDEIGEIPMFLQAKLLRILQEGSYRRLGDPEERRVDIRIIAATNADLQALMEAERFRRDLFYRLQIFELHLPPLRDRGVDIDTLIRLFVQKAAGDAAVPEDLFDETVLMALRRYPWPGNVRQLAAMTRRLALMAVHADSAATAEMLPPEISRWLKSRSGVRDGLSLAVHLEHAERERIMEALVQTDGNRSAAARALEISRNTLYKKMDRLGIQGRR